MANPDNTTSLDFTGLLAPKPRPPEPPKVPKKLPDEIIIGAKALKKGGYFVNVTHPQAKRIPRPENLTVLIVEDDPDTVRLIDLVLTRAAYRTRKAATGAEFVAAIKTPPIPDLILLDIELPDVSGVAILEKLRAHSGTKSIPVVVLSAHSEPRDVYKCMNLGADGYISKPTKSTVLVQALKEVLGG